MKITAADQTKEKIKAEYYERFSPKGLFLSRFKRMVRGKGWLYVFKIISAAKRVLDFSAALLILLILAPLFSLTFIVLRKKQPKLIRSPRVGRYGEIFQQYSFNVSENRFGKLWNKFKITQLPILFNIIRGDLSWIGPRAVTPLEVNLKEKAVRRRFDARPGLFCLWWIRRRANIDYGSEFDSDSEYVNSYGVWNDLGIAVRTVPAMLYGGNGDSAPDKIEILGIPINNTTMTEAVDLISEQLDSKTAKQFCFVNADCANISSKNSVYKNVLVQAGYVFADGIGMKLAGKVLNTGIKQNVNGTDLFPRLCERLSDTPKSIFLLGAKPEIPEAVRDWVKTNYPLVNICGTRHGYFTAEEEPQILREINESNADLLLVAFGAPRQDLWIAENLSKLNVKAAIGVGGLFDYYSGRIPRAPQWLREMGLEWFFRFYQEPGRMWRRYFVGNFIFLARASFEKFGKKN